MKTLTFSVLFLVATICVFAQIKMSTPGSSPATSSLWSAYENEKQIYAGRLFRSMSNADKYVYDHFIEGHFLYPTGEESPTVKLNFNIFYASFEMIDEHGDTLMLTHVHPAKYIVTEKDVFIHRWADGFFKVVDGKTDPVKLVSVDNINMISRTRFDKTPPTFANPSKKNQFIAIYKPKDPMLKDEVVLLSHTETLCLLDANENLFPATRTGFLKAFSSRQTIINNYLISRAKQRNPVRFNHEQDLRELLAFCNKAQTTRLR